MVKTKECSIISQFMYGRQYSGQRGPRSWSLHVPNFFCVFNTCSRRQPHRSAPGINPVRTVHHSLAYILLLRLKLHSAQQACASPQASPQSTYTRLFGLHPHAPLRPALHEANPCAPRPAPHPGNPHAHRRAPAPGNPHSLVRLDLHLTHTHLVRLHPPLTHTHLVRLHPQFTHTHLVRLQLCLHQLHHLEGHQLVAGPVLRKPDLGEATLGRST